MVRGRKFFHLARNGRSGMLGNRDWGLDEVARFCSTLSRLRTLRLRKSNPHLKISALLDASPYRSLERNLQRRFPWRFSIKVYTIAYRPHWVVAMHFEWDGRKNIANFRKHGVWFEEAKTAWEDVFAISFYDEQHSLQEERHLYLGLSRKMRLLLVSYLELEENSIRLISARKATRTEAQHHEKRIRLIKT
jgi:uncharacterized protein